MKPERVPAETLKAGDIPISLAGFRPATAVKVRPRLGRVEITVGSRHFAVPVGTQIAVHR